MEQKYQEYMLEQLQALLAIDSPSGYTDEVTAYLTGELKKLGLEPQLPNKGGVNAKIGGSGNGVSYHNRGIMTRLAKIMEDMGYRYFDWNASASDAKEGHKDWKASRYNGVIMGKLKKDGSPTVVLQHDLNGASVRALETFIPWALENGYTFLPLDMTSPVMHTPVNN